MNVWMILGNGKGLSEATIDAVTKIVEQLICSVALGRINGNYGGTAPNGSVQSLSSLGDISAENLINSSCAISLAQNCNWADSNRQGTKETEIAFENYKNIIEVICEDV
ncbi:hypothetical protein FQA39_LY14655 [Lamprigera yunnana]|nr:hypothetical protein FQA39_LY14655 [Lamprigera yunnana]